MIKDLVKQNRSYRGYDESRRVTEAELREMVDCARLTASSVNMQPLKYYLAWESPSHIIGTGTTSITCRSADWRRRYLVCIILP